MRARGTIAIAVAVAAGLFLSWVFWRLSPHADGSGDAGEVGHGAPQRVILFAPNLTEAACALGHASSVVAITDYCVWPAAILDRPRVGGMIDPNFEGIAALAPDLLVLQGENAPLRAFARQQSIRVASVKMDDDVASILAGIARLDSLLTGGRPVAAAGLIAGIRGDLSAIAARAADLPRPRVLLVLGHQPGSLSDLYTVGGGTFLSELVEIAGGRAAQSDRRRAYFQLSLETLLADPPEVALEIRAGQTLDEKERAEIRGVWATLGLVDTRVEMITFDGILVPGPRIAESARCLQEAIHPELAGGESGLRR